MGKIKSYVKNWGLPIAMTCGALAYFAIHALPLSGEVKLWGFHLVSHYIQPIMIFVMLFLNFLKVRPREMRPHRWQLWVLILQASFFMFFSVLAMQCESHATKILCEGAMLAFICPTATASAVITGKLGGSIAEVVTYLMMCNLMVSLVAPLFLPMVEPSVGLTFLPSFLLILSKVFPLLICPLVAAQLVRYLLPKVHRRLMRYPDLAFQIWMPSLALAIMVTVRSIVHSSVDWRYMVGLALISGVCCLMQFWMGRRVGGVTAGQAFGQKNTVFIIWLGLVFLDPVTSVVGGFYSVWHNTVNSWELYRARKKTLFAVSKDTAKDK